MKKEEFIILAKKYNENLCTPSEKRAVEAFFNYMQDQKNPILTDEKGKIILDKINAHIKTRKLVLRNRNILRAAVILIIALGLGIGINSFNKTILEITAIAAKGEKREIVLSDGSIVVLNSNSSITYPENFGDTRNVKLSGEAYFKVHHNPQKPFIVAVHGVSVKVLGTSFNIESYDHRETKVSVLAGKVEVSSPSGKKVQLIKNQQASLKEDSDFSLLKENSRDGIAWTENIIILKNTTLAETAKIIENWYNVQIDFEDKSLEELTISGKFKEEKLENVLESIAFLKQVKIIYITKNKILIRRNS
ncbi:MAG TPA: FecR domain-containing protein [Cytophagaceae bacterium]